MSHVAFLRSINVGGHNRVTMEALRGVFVGLGHGAVKTYVQSGNLWFTPVAVTDNVSVAAGIEAAILDKLGLSVPVVVRTRSALAEVVAAGPYPGADPSIVMVVLLRDAPSDAQIATLDPARSPPDECVVRGREVYCHCPRGFAKTKLTLDWLENRLGTVGTARNWRTVTTMAAGGQ